VIVDEQAFLDIIDQMRIAIPDEIRKAKRVVDGQEQLLTDATEEAERIQAAAQEQASLLLSREGLIQMADERASDIIDSARVHANQLMADADAHCLDVLGALEEEMSALLAQTRNGINHMQASTGDAVKRTRIEGGEKTK
jgi:hypothetical protein